MFKSIEIYYHVGVINIFRQLLQSHWSTITHELWIKSEEIIRQVDSVCYTIYDPSTPPVMWGTFLQFGHDCCRHTITYGGFLRADVIYSNVHVQITTLVDRKKKKKSFHVLVTRNGRRTLSRLLL